MDCFCVQWKETTLGGDNVMNVDIGVCDLAYINEKDAIKQVGELVEEKVDECVNELGYEEDEVDTTMNENGDYQSVTCGSNTYEYWVMRLDVV